MNYFQWRCLYHKNNFDLIKIGFHVDEHPKTRLPYLEYDSVSQIHCGSCPYYTGIQCHDHGDYWGECSLLNSARKILSSVFGVYSHKLYLQNTKEIFEEIRYDECECIIFRVEK